VVKGNPTTARTDLKGIAKAVFQDALWKHTESTGAQIAQKYDLNDAQLARVKQYIKEMAAEQGVLWGYDDYLGRYRVCPDNDKKAAARMLRWHFGHWQRQGKSLQHLARGAHLQGLITRAQLKRLTAVPQQTNAVVDAAIKMLLRIEETNEKPSKLLVSKS